MIKIKVKSKIKEGLKGPDDQIKTDIIRAFIRAGDSVEQLQANLEQINIPPLDAIEYLNKDIMDSQAYIRAVELHNGLARKLDPEKTKKLDAFAQFPKIGHNPHQDQGANRLVEPMDDPRRDAKNLKGGVSENKMKITKQYIKQIIEEELNQILEDSHEKDKEKDDEEEFDKDTEDFQKWPKGKDIEPDEED